MTFYLGNIVMYLGMAPIAEEKSFVRSVNWRGVGVIFERIVMEAEIKNMYVYI